LELWLDTKGQIPLNFSTFEASFLHPKTDHSLYHLTQAVSEEEVRERRLPQDKQMRRNPVWGVLES